MRLRRLTPDWRTSAAGGIVGAAIVELILREGGTVFAVRGQRASLGSALD